MMLLSPLPAQPPESENADAVDLGLAWKPGAFVAMGAPFSTACATRPLAESAYLVAASAEVASQIGLDTDRFADTAVLEALAGNRPLQGAQTSASVYSGHQFGVWAGQLGDGRALLLGEIAAPTASGGLEIQFKGAGPTPYSRGGDGRAVLRSSIREFLCSEAMHALGVPTTRALCVVGSDAPVRRETIETAAVVTRVAESFIRFGHFEHYAAAGNIAALKQLADHVIDRHYPQCRSASHPYAALLAEVALRTADLMAHWQAIGFCHGVMNTDNMSILGLTIDYGPFQFLDGFNPAHVCNHSDNQGRYAFNQQPDVAYWNLFCLAQALMPLLGDASPTPPEEVAIAALEPYKERFSAAYQRHMRAKLGLAAPVPGDGALIESLLRLLASERTDWTIFWRRLTMHLGGSSVEPVRDLFADRAALDNWLLQYKELLAHAHRAPDTDLMLQSNPAYVLRNHLGEEAIRAAHAGDFEPTRALHAALSKPFTAQPWAAHYADLPPDWASSIEISCSS